MRDDQKSKDILIDELNLLRNRIQRLESQIRRTENAYKDSQLQLQQSQKMEALGTLVAGVAHEINNPINLIMYNLPLLEKIWADFLPALMALKEESPDRKFGGFTYDFLKDNLAQLVTDMNLAANRVAKIVADLKNFSRQSNVVEKSPLEINTAVKNALRLAQTTLRNSGVELKLELDDDLPMIEGNLQSIEQIVLNIIINAIQAIGDDSGKIGIKTGFHFKDGRCFIQVKDTGRGIAASIADKIFLPFISDKQLEGGTGLGLSVTYSLVKAHDGEIAFESREGEGTTFTVFLPTLMERQAAKILVVDDDKMIRQMLIEALTMDRNYLVEEASNGIEASIKLGTYRPDLVILDIFMPEMDGLEVCRSIKAEPELAGMNVIITTGYPEHSKLDEIAELGFTNVFYKPFDLSKFKEGIEKILDER